MSTATVTETPSSTDRRDEKPLGGRFVAGAANYIDERTSLSGMVKELGRKIFPDHWSFMLGEIALWSFVVVLLSGTFLTFFFQASMVETHYQGAYEPMRGIAMSAALARSATPSGASWPFVMNRQGSAKEKYSPSTCSRAAASSEAR